MICEPHPFEFAHVPKYTKRTAAANYGHSWPAVPELLLLQHTQGEGRRMRVIPHKTHAGRHGPNGSVLGFHFLDFDDSFPL